MNWYRFDVLRFSYEMMPPLLRGKLIIALIGVLVRPLVSLMYRFEELRMRCRSQLIPSGQILAIEEALRERYHLHQGDVYITEPEDVTTYLYLLTEEAKTAELPLTLYHADENPNHEDYTIHLPEYLKRDEADVYRIIELYRPAGRKYQITYYPYE